MKMRWPSSSTSAGSHSYDQAYPVIEIARRGCAGFRKGGPGSTFGGEKQLSVVDDALGGQGRRQRDRDFPRALLLLADRPS